MILSLILILAFLLRLVGVSFGLPHIYHADEPIVVHHALAYGTGDLNPHFFKIPPLVSYLLFGIYGLYYLGGHAVGAFASVGEFEELFYRDPTAFYLLARLIFGVFFGTLTVYVLYRLVAKESDSRRALVATFFLAVTFLHVRDSHYVYVDIPLVLTMLGVMFPILAIVRSQNNWREHLLSGAGIGLAAALKYNGIALGVPYVFASLIAEDQRGRVRKWISAAALSAVVFFLLNPFALLDTKTFLRELVMQSKAQGGVGWLHHFVYSLPNGLGILLFLGALMGMALHVHSLIVLYGSRKDPVLRITYPRTRDVFLVFILSYYALISLAGQPYDRYVLPLLPFLVFFAADFTVSVSEWIRPANNRVLVALSLLLAVPSLLSCLLFDRLMLAKDTRTQAREWVETHIPPGSKLALDWDFYMPRLRFSARQLKEKLEEVERNPHFSEAQRRRLEFYLKDWENDKMPQYELYFLAEDPEGRFLFARPTVPYHLETLKELGIEYVLALRFHPDDHPAFLRKLQDAGQRLARFTPYRNKQIEYPLDEQPLTGGPFLFRDLLMRERNGLIIEIYRLKD